MIYFIQCGTNGPIKVGQTDNDVKSRMTQLQTGCPYELKLLWVYTGHDYTESKIHEELSKERIRGEWFHPSKTVFDFINNELGNHFEIQTQNGRYIDFVESLYQLDSASILSEKGWHHIFYGFNKGDLYIDSRTSSKVDLI
jgi:hypothetical protein